MSGNIIFLYCIGRNGRVVLNVGGKRFETLIDTLQKFPDTMLGAMFSPRGMSMAVPDENGEVCITNKNINK